MSRWVMRVGADWPTPRAGMYLRTRDIEARHHRRWATFTRDINEALSWPTYQAAFNAWREISKTRPVRPDGLPNRPLTSWTIEFVEVK